MIVDMAPILAQHRDDIRLLGARRGVSNIRVFGSAAADKLGPESDVDFLVDLQPGHTLLDLGALLIDLQELLHRKVDVVTVNSLHWYIRDRILRDAIPL